MNATLFSIVYSELKRRKKIILWVTLVVLMYGVTVGVIAPKVIMFQAQKTVQQRLGLSLNVERFRVNPFVFTVEVKGLELHQGDGEPLFGFERFYVDFETSSVFRWAWTLNHLQLTGLTAHVERFTEEENTLSRLKEAWLSSAPIGQPAVVSSAAEVSSSPQALPRFLVRDIQFQIAATTIVDHIPATAFRNTIGPVDMGIDELTSLPGRLGTHHILIKGDHGVEISWLGDINLTTLESHGEILINGPYPVIASDYLQDSLPAIIDGGYLSASFDYQLKALPESSVPLALSLSDINATLDDLSIVEKSTRDPLFSLQKASISKASLKWPEQSVTLPYITLRGGELWLQRDDSGTTNIERLLSTQATSFDDSNEAGTKNLTSSSQNASPQPSGALPWTVKNALFEVDDWALHWLDQTIEPAPQYDISNLSLAIHGYQLKDSEPVSFEYGLSLLGGDISGEGTVVPMPFGHLSAKVSIQELLLPQLQPYIGSAARVVIEDGLFDGAGLVESVDDDFIVESSFAVSELRVVKGFDAGGGEPQDLLRWQKLTVDDIQATAKGNAVSIKRIVLDTPFADFAIEKDGTTTIDKILLAPSPVAEPPLASKPDSEFESKGVDDQSAKYHFKIGSVSVSDGAGYFADASLPLPFATKIHHLNGGITEVDSQSKASADLEMEGQLDEYGLLSIDGSLSPFAFDQQSDLILSFKNVNVPNFTPYAVKFAGRKITDGRLDLKLKYAFDKGEMLGSNDVVLKSFNLGESIDHPGAMDLPLDLAVALLKDSEGKITMNVPVSGDVNNPEFSVGSVVGQALVKILTSAVTSPFRLLAGLVGSNAEDFGQVVFSAGRADITPPEKEKLDALAKAMQQRPDLALEVAGVFDGNWDAAVLRQHQFDKQAKGLLGEQFQNLSLSSNEYIKYLEGRYQVAQLLPVLSELRLDFLSIEGKRTLDQLAYAKEIKRRLVAEEVVPEKVLQALADQRANNVKTILLAQGVLEKTVTLAPPVKLDAKKESDLIMKLNVAVAD